MKARLLAALLAFLAASAFAAAIPVDVYKRAECGCCDKWVEHIRAAGFDVRLTVVEDTAPYRAKAGVPQAMAACHTAFVGGYAIEGHVPVADIQRLLSKRPAAKALVVPDMPQTSPGMDRPTGPAWEVFVLNNDGSRAVFASYPAK